MDLAGGASGLRTEISGELASVLASVTEASGDTGRRYDARTCRLLLQAIAARAYGRPLLELAYLIAAADRMSGRHGYLGFFWGVREATVGAFRAMALSAPPPGEGVRNVLVEAQELAIRSPGAEFRISYSRMPFLAALLDFCVTALGFSVVDGEVAEFLAGARGREGAQKLANSLSRRLYEFLKQHLPSQQHERKFNAMTAFISARSGRRAGADAVDDRTVLAFWEDRCAAPAGGGDFRGFRTVALDFLRLREALRLAETRQAVEAAVSIGAARDSGDVDPDDVLSALEVSDEKRSALVELGQPPANRLKSLNKREVARLDLLVEAGDAAGALPMTLLRAEVFGDHQARIIQAIRKRQTLGGTRAVEMLIEAAPVEDYRTAVNTFRMLAVRLVKTRKALMYILFLQRRPEALEIGLALFPEAADALRERVSKESFSGNVVELHSGVALRALLDHAISDAPEESPEAEIFRQGRLAFAKINRRGFEEAGISDPEIAEAAAASEPLVRSCGSDLDHFLRALDRHFSQLPPERAFAEDCRRFRIALQALYGELA